MSLGVLAIGYVGLGAIAALICGLAKKLGLVDGVLVLVMWPLYAPFLLLGGGRDLDAREAELLAALARAASSPLGAMLPDAESGRVLARRLREASARLVELEAVLARPDFDPVVAERRVQELTARGATAAAGTAALRLRTLGHLRALRGRYRAELDEVGELVAQLVAQAELVRLEPSQASGDLVRELVNRLEGLGDLFVYQAALEGGDPVEFPVPAARSS